MGFEFLVRVRKVTFTLTVLAAVAAVVYGRPAFGLALALGSLWSLGNLYVLESLGRLLLAMRLERPAGWRDALVFLGGLPVLLVGGWGLLASPLSLWALTLGFWILFAVVVLKALGVAMARALDFRTGRSREPGRAAMARPLPSRRSLGLTGWAVVAVLAGGLVLWAAASPDEPAGAGAGGPAISQSGEHGETAHGDGDPGAAGAHAGDTHGGGHGEGDVPHLPTFVTLLEEIFPHAGWVEFLKTWEDLLFALLATAILTALVALAFSKPQLVPGKGQALVEGIAQGSRDFLVGTFGPQMERYVPFLGTLFFYILVMNWMGMVPFLKSATASLNTTLAMAIVVFFFVQYTALRTQGLGGYLYHLAGEPKNLLGWGVALLLFPIEVMGEFIKPISLAARLFGNIFGEDLLVAVFVGIGAVLLSWQPLPIGFPIHVLFVALALIMSVVQALVFALLAAVYLYMAMPHHEHAEEEHPVAQLGEEPATA